MPRTEFIVFCPDCFFPPSFSFPSTQIVAQASNLKFTVHVKLKPGLENFEHYFASMWDECNCMVVWAFFGIAFLWDCDENWHFPGLRLILSFTFFFVSKLNQSSLRDQSPKDGSNPSMSLHSLCHHQVQNIIIDILDSHMALLSGVVFLNYKSDHATLLPKSSCGSPVPSEWSPNALLWATRPHSPSGHFLIFLLHGPLDIILYRLECAWPHSCLSNS